VALTNACKLSSLFSWMAGCASQVREAATYVVRRVQSIPRKLQFDYDFLCRRVSERLEQKKGAGLETMEASPKTKEPRATEYSNAAQCLIRVDSAPKLKLTSARGMRSIPQKL